MAAVAVDCGNVRPAHPVVLEAFIEWLDTHRPHSLGNQFADRIVHHRRRYSGPQAEAVRQIGGDVKLTAADMNLTFGRFAEGNDSRIKAVDQGAE